jgi:hypothetical protein
VKGEWETIDEIQGIFCKKATRSPRRTVNGAAKRELGRGSSRGKVLCSAVKHWYRNVSM